MRCRRENGAGGWVGKMTKTEAVAQALWERGHPPCGWDELNKPGNEYAAGGFLKAILDDATAAIAAADRHDAEQEGT